MFYELWSRPLTTIAKGSWPQQHLNICQANNPFEQVATPYPQINIEQVLQTPVDLIIQPMSINHMAKEGFNWQDWPIIPRCWSAEPDPSFNKRGRGPRSRGIRPTDCPKRKKGRLRRP